MPYVVRANVRDLPAAGISSVSFADRNVRTETVSGTFYVMQLAVKAFQPRRSPSVITSFVFRAVILVGLSFKAQAAQFLRPDEAVTVLADSKPWTGAKRNGDKLALPLTRMGPVASRVR